MKVVVTGGAGFLGQLLIRALAARGSLTDATGTQRSLTQILAVDPVQSGKLFIDDRVEYVAGDAANASFLEHVLGLDSASVFHLAAVVSGAAEADFDLGLRVNLDGTRALLDTARRQKAPPKLVFASSVAVFGGQLPAVVTDATAPAPQSSYGVQKLVGELLLGDYARKGFIDGRAVRLPTIVVRPGRPNAAASGFASSIIREPLAGAPAVCPVALATPLWLMSPQRAIDALIHAHELPADRWRGRQGGRALNLPGLTVTVDQMLQSLARVGGAAAVARVSVQPDASIAAIVQSWPARFATQRAADLGFDGDVDFDRIVGDYAAAYPPAAGEIR